MNIKQAALAHGLKEEVMDVPEWGADVKVLVKELTSGQRNRFLSVVRLASERGKPIPENYTAEIVIATAYDPESGDPAFDKVDRDALTDLPSGPLEAIASKALELSGITEEAVEQAEKNSERVTGEVYS